MHDLAKAYPDDFEDYQIHKARTGRFTDSQLVADLETLIKAGGITHPPPAPFDQLDPSQLIRLVPVNYRHSLATKVVIDPEALSRVIPPHDVVLIKR